MLELCAGSSTAGGTSPSAGSSIVVPAEGHAGPSVPGGGPDPGPEPPVKRRKRNDAPNSYFCRVLIDSVTSGRHAVTSLARARTLAESSNRNSLWAGGLAHPANEAFASLGSDGLHENNIERDVHSWMRRTKTMVDVPIQWVPVRMWDWRLDKVVKVMHPMLNPHEVFHAACLDPAVFQNSMLGPEGRSGIQKQNFTMMLVYVSFVFPFRVLTLPHRFRTSVAKHQVGTL